MSKDIAALVSSRICHDLISPIGAIGNGVELLSLTNGETSDEMALISESVANANARIRFFRIAYGGADADQMVSRSEILSVLAASARGGRFTFFWQVEGDQPRRDVRIAFLLLQCIETALPLGGDITISQTGGAWDITAHADRIDMDDDLWDGLKRAKVVLSMSPAKVQFAVLPSVLAEARRTLAISTGPDKLSVSF